MSIKRKKVSEEMKQVDDFNVMIYKTFLLPNGKEKTFGIRTKRNYAHVFGLTQENKIIMTKQFRPGPEEYIFEIAGGFLNGDEHPLVGAQREFLEETGYTGDFKQIAKLYSSPYSDAFQYLFFATNCKKIAEQHLDESEDIEIVLVNKEDIWDVLENNHCLQIDLIYKGLDYLYNFKTKM